MYTYGVNRKGGPAVIRIVVYTDEEAEGIDMIDLIRTVGHALLGKESDHAVLPLFPHERYPEYNSDASAIKKQSRPVPRTETPWNPSERSF